MTTSSSADARERADRAFKSKSEPAMSAAAAERFAREDKTARLRALRLAKEAADQESAAHAAPRRRK